MRRGDIGPDATGHTLHTRPTTTGTEHAAIRTVASIAARLDAPLNDTLEALAALGLNPAVTEMAADRRQR